MLHYTGLRPDQLEQPKQLNVRKKPHADTVSNPLATPTPCGRAPL